MQPDEETNNVLPVTLQDNQLTFIYKHPMRTTLYQPFNKIYLPF